MAALKRTSQVKGKINAVQTRIDSQQLKIEEVFMLSYTFVYIYCDINALRIQHGKCFMSKVNCSIFETCVFVYGKHIRTGNKYDLPANQPTRKITVEKKM